MMIKTRLNNDIHNGLLSRCNTILRVYYMIILLKYMRFKFLQIFKLFSSKLRKIHVYLILLWCYLVTDDYLCNFCFRIGKVVNSRI